MVVSIQSQRNRLHDMTTLKRFQKTPGRGCWEPVDGEVSAAAKISRVCKGDGRTFAQQHVQRGEHAVERAHVGAVARRIKHHRGRGRRTESVRAHDRTCAAEKR